MADTASPAPSTFDPPPLTNAGRYIILIVAFFGWFFAGTQMAVTSIAMRAAAKDLLGAASVEGDVGNWFSFYITAFLLGAAAGGLVFGWFGDRFGRKKAMAFAILWYSVFSGLGSYADSPTQLLILRFVGCMGVGGMWPNGVALVSEAWANLSRPAVAGIIGTAANVGILTMSLGVKGYFEIDNPGPGGVDVEWRGVLWLASVPAFLGVFAVFAVPESPRWLAARAGGSPSETTKKPATPISEVFGSRYIGILIVGIILGTVPLLGGWGSSSWMNPWASQVGGDVTSADVTLWRSLTGSVSSLLGGWVGSLIGRRLAYFLFSVGALACAQYIFWFLSPENGTEFLFWVGLLGLFSGFYFGWLPLCLPEMFPTRIRSTGAGVSFNFGRILSAVTVLGAGAALAQWLDGDYAVIGRITSFIYAIGMIAILFAPDTSKKGLED